jgi:hypothetical protein
MEQFKKCRIRWVDDRSESDVTIKIGEYDKEFDDFIFFYCDSESDFESLMEGHQGVEEFEIIEVYEA